MTANSLRQRSPVDDMLLERLSGRQETMVNQTVDWSGINTGSWNADGLNRLAPIIADRMSRLPAEIALEANSGIEVISPKGSVAHEPTGPVITASCRLEAPVQVVFTGHYDTVFPPSLGFDQVKDLGEGRLNGPGLADMKGGLVVLLEALEAFESSPNASKLGYRLVFTPDEEIGNPVSAPFLMRAARTAQVGMTYEPALEDGGFAGARKGSGNFSIVVRGRAAHAGRAHHLGVSAIRIAAEIVVAIENQNGRRTGVTFNTGKIEGGGPNNQVPDLAIVRLNARVPDLESRDWALHQINHVIDYFGSGEGVQIELHGGFYRPPKPFNSAQSVLFEGVKETGKALGLNLGWTDTGGVCEGNNVFAAGVPNIDTLGVRGGRIHSTEEYVETSSFVERASLSVLLLNRFADGRLDAARIKSLMPAQ